MNISAFDKNVRILKQKKGWLAECKKGLFAVKGNSERQVRKEAMHYFVQYLNDGEYDK